TSTYDHRVWKTGLPVRSAVLKPHAGRLVVGWVTTSESLLLYVFAFVSCLLLVADLHSFRLSKLQPSRRMAAMAAMAFGRSPPYHDTCPVKLFRTFTFKAH
ncbi:hypothetical protein BO97DRAFT_456369, partial [Aspergillus homomorphus CBS 101889]